MRYAPAFLHTGGAAVLTPTAVGGLLHPDPSHRMFGDREFFHALTVAAFTAHYIAIVLAIYRPPLRPASSLATGRWGPTPGETVPSD